MSKSKKLITEYLPNPSKVEFNESTIKQELAKLLDLFNKSNPEDIFKSITIEPYTLTKDDKKMIKLCDLFSDLTKEDIYGQNIADINHCSNEIAEFFENNIYRIIKNKINDIDDGILRRFMSTIAQYLHMIIKCPNEHGNLIKILSNISNIINNINKQNAKLIEQCPYLNIEEVYFTISIGECTLQSWQLKHLKRSIVLLLEKVYKQRITNDDQITEILKTHRQELEDLIARINNNQETKWIVSVLDLMHNNLIYQPMKLYKNTLILILINKIYATLETQNITIDDKISSKIFSLGIKGPNYLLNLLKIQDNWKEIIELLPAHLRDIYNDQILNEKLPRNIYTIKELLGITYEDIINENTDENTDKKIDNTLHSVLSEAIYIQQLIRDLIKKAANILQLHDSDLFQNTSILTCEIQNILNHLKGQDIKEMKKLEELLELPHNNENYNYEVSSIHIDNETIYKKILEKLLSNNIITPKLKPCFRTISNIYIIKQQLPTLKMRFSTFKTNYKNPFIQNSRNNDYITHNEETSKQITLMSFAILRNIIQPKINPQVPLKINKKHPAYEEFMKYRDPKTYEEEKNTINNNVNRLIGEFNTKSRIPREKFVKLWNIQSLTQKAASLLKINDPDLLHKIALLTSEIQKILKHVTTDNFCNITSPLSEAIANLKLPNNTDYIYVSSEYLNNNNIYQAIVININNKDSLVSLETIQNKYIQILVQNDIFHPYHKEPDKYDYKYVTAKIFTISFGILNEVINIDKKNNKVKTNEQHPKYKEFKELIQLKTLDSIDKTQIITQEQEIKKWNEHRIINQKAE